MEIWVKPLSHQNLAVCFLNRSDRPQNVDYVWMDHLIQDNISHININFKESRYKLRDLWTRKEFGTTQKPFKATIPSHDVVMLKLTKVN
jgi:alpha-galactosidase